MRTHLWQKRLRDARQKQDFPPGLLQVHRLREAADSRRQLRFEGGRALLQRAPQGLRQRGRHHRRGREQQQQEHPKQQQQQQRGRRRQVGRR